MGLRGRPIGNVAGWVSIVSALVLAGACATLSNPNTDVPFPVIVVPFCTGLLGAILSVLLGSWRWLAVLVPWLVVAGLAIYVLSQPLTTIL